MREEERKRIETKSGDHVGMADKKSVKIQEKVGIAGAKGGSQTTSSMTSQNSGVTRPTIGETTISSNEAARIKDEVRSELRKMFLGIAQFEMDSTSLNREAEFSQPETTAATALDFSGQSRHSRPEAIAGLEMYVVTTHPNNEAEESQNSFSQLISTGAGDSAQTFANV